MSGSPAITAAALFGGGARAAVSISPLFVARFDVLADYAEVGRATGSVAVIMPSVSAALGVSRWIGASLRPAISVGLRGGYVRMNGIADGTAATGAHQQGVWLGPELALQISAWPRARVLTIDSSASQWSAYDVTPGTSAASEVRLASPAVRNTVFVFRVERRARVADTRWS